MSDKTENVKWGQLGIFITIVSTIFVGLFMTITAIKNDITEIKIDVATTKNDVSWLRKEWEKLSGQGEVTISKQGNLLEKMYEK